MENKPLSAIIKESREFYHSKYGEYPHKMNITRSLWDDLGHKEELKDLFPSLNKINADFGFISFASKEMTKTRQGHDSIEPKRFMSVWNDETSKKWRN